jgi:hypothetical protein
LQGRGDAGEYALRGTGVNPTTACWRVPLPLTREAKAGGAEPRPYGVYISAEIIWWAIRESPIRS